MTTKIIMQEFVRECSFPAARSPHHAAKLLIHNYLSQGGDALRQRINREAYHA